jgi:hypothetical protein
VDRFDKLTTGFGAEPAPAATQGLSLLAAPFLGAPAAQG